MTTSLIEKMKSRVKPTRWPYRLDDETLQQLEEVKAAWLAGDFEGISLRSIHKDLKDELGITVTSQTVYNYFKE